MKLKLTVSALESGGRLLVYRREGTSETDTPILAIDAAGTYEIESSTALTSLNLVAEGGAATISRISPDSYGTVLILK